MNTRYEDYKGVQVSASGINGMTIREIQFPDGDTRAAFFDAVWGDGTFTGGIDMASANRIILYVREQQ